MDMKKFIYFIISYILIISCDNKHETCIYNENTRIDTTLFVTVIINGMEHRFYQFEPIYVVSPWDACRVLDLNDSIIDYRVFYYINYVSNTEIIPNAVNSTRDLGFTFSKRIKVYNYEQFDINHPFEDLFNIFTNPIDFAINREAHEISSHYFYEIGNSIFTDGISIDLLIKDSPSSSYYRLSSDDIFEYYDFNNDSINQYFNNNSSFDITKVEIVCDNIYYVEGTFNIKLLDKPNDEGPLKYIELKGGKFKFIEEYN